MGVVGIDPGINRTAVSASPTTWRLITPEGHWHADHKLAYVGAETVKFVRDHAPALIVIEEPGFTVKGHGGAGATVERAIGAILAALYAYRAEHPHVEVRFVPVSRVRSKLEVHSKRGRHKEAVVEYVLEYGCLLPERNPFDAADAHLLRIYGERERQVLV